MVCGFVSGIYIKMVPAFKITEPLDANWWNPEQTKWYFVLVYTLYFVVLYVLDEILNFFSLTILQKYWWDVYSHYLYWY